MLTDASSSMGEGAPVPAGPSPFSRLMKMGMTGALQGFGQSLMPDYMSKAYDKGQSGITDQYHFKYIKNHMLGDMGEEDATKSEAARKHKSKGALDRLKSYGSQPAPGGL